MFKDIVKLNRSYRGYDESRVITKEELMDFIDCARLSPSSVNMQPFKYYLSYEKEEVEKILALTHWAKALPDIKLPHDNMHPTAFIILCQDLSINEAETRFLKDVGICAQTILLAAAEVGLGGCMIGNYSPTQIKNALNLADNYSPKLVIAIGKPAETVILEDTDSENVKYYRDENDAHHVPKRKLEDIII